MGNLLVLGNATSISRENLPRLEFESTPRKGVNGCSANLMMNDAEFTLIANILCNQE